MNASNSPVRLRVWHYQFWCGACLAVVFVAQLSQGIFLTNVLVFLVGLLGIVSRLRWGVLYLMVGVGFCQSVHFFMTERPTLGWRAVSRDLDLHDFLLALGVLCFAVGYQRLQGMWHHAWPSDPRERRGKPKPTFLWMRPRPPVVDHRRRDEHLRSSEIVKIAFFAPLLVLAGVMLFTFVRPARGVDVWLDFPGNLGRFLPPGLGHFVLLFWIFLLFIWLTRHVLDLWRFWTLPPTTARLYVHDQIWNQLRGEQRRIARWQAWRNLQ